MNAAENMEDSELPQPNLDALWATTVADIVGKRIESAVVYHQPESGRKRIVLFFSDYHACLISAGKSVVRFTLPDWESGLSVDGGMSTCGFEPIEEAREDQQIKKEVEHLYLTLWTKATGTSDYIKREWQRLGAFLHPR